MSEPEMSLDAPSPKQRRVDCQCDLCYRPKEECGGLWTLICNCPPQTRKVCSDCALERVSDPKNTVNCADCDCSISALERDGTRVPLHPDTRTQATFDALLLDRGAWRPTTACSFDSFVRAHPEECAALVGELLASLRALGAEHPGCAPLTIESGDGKLFAYDWDDVLTMAALPEPAPDALALFAATHAIQPGRLMVAWRDADCRHRQTAYVHRASLSRASALFDETPSRRHGATYIDPVIAAISRLLHDCRAHPGIFEAVSAGAKLALPRKTTRSHYMLSLVERGQFTSVMDKHPYSKDNAIGGGHDNYNTARLSGYREGEPEVAINLDLLRNDYISRKDVIRIHPGLDAKASDTTWRAEDFNHKLLREVLPEDGPAQLERIRSIVCPDEGVLKRLGSVVEQRACLSIQSRNTSAPLRLLTTNPVTPRNCPATMSRWDNLIKMNLNEDESGMGVFDLQMKRVKAILADVGQGWNREGTALEFSEGARRWELVIDRWELLAVHGGVLVGDAVPYRQSCNRMRELERHDDPRKSPYYFVRLRYLETDGGQPLWVRIPFVRPIIGYWHFAAKNLHSEIAGFFSKVFLVHMMSAPTAHQKAAGRVSISVGHNVKNPDQSKIHSALLLAAFWRTLYNEFCERSRDTDGFDPETATLGQCVDFHLERIETCPAARVSFSWAVTMTYRFALEDAAACGDLATLLDCQRLTGWVPPVTGAHKYMQVFFEEAVKFSVESKFFKEMASHFWLHAETGDGSGKSYLNDIVNERMNLYLNKRFDGWPGFTAFNSFLREGADGKIGLRSGEEPRPSKTLHLLQDGASEPLLKSSSRWTPTSTLLSEFEEELKAINLFGPPGTSIWVGKPGTSRDHRREVDGRTFTSLCGEHELLPEAVLNHVDIGYKRYATYFHEKHAMNSKQTTSAIHLGLTATHSRCMEVLQYDREWSEDASVLQMGHIVGDGDNTRYIDNEVPQKGQGGRQGARTMKLDDCRAAIEKLSNSRSQSRELRGKFREAVKAKDAVTKETFPDWCEKIAKGRRCAREAKESQFVPPHPRPVLRLSCVADFPKQVDRKPLPAYLACMSDKWRTPRGCKSTTPARPAPGPPNVNDAGPPPLQAPPRLDSFEKVTLFSDNSVERKRPCTRGRRVVAMELESQLVDSNSDDEMTLDPLTP